MFETPICLLIKNNNQKGNSTSKKMRVADSELINSEREAQRAAIQQRLANKLKSLGGNDTKPEKSSSPVEAASNDANKAKDAFVPALDKSSDVTPAAVEEPATIAPAAVEAPATDAPAAVEEPATVAPAAVEEPATIAPAAVEEPAVAAPAEKNATELASTKV